MNALEVRNLSKEFEKVKAVTNASFEVPDGSIFGLIGRNGAGKTTTLRLILKIFLPDSGEILFRGRPVDGAFRNSVGYLPEERGLYKKMTVLDTLLFFAEIKGKSPKDMKTKALEYLKKFNLYDRRNSKIEDLSKGNQQKIQFIATVLHDPDLIILDEPFSGLDPINIDLLRQIILEKKEEGKVIIFSTHLMDYAEKMVDHLAMIDHGKIILKGSLPEIKSKFSQRNVSINFDGDISFLRKEPFVEKITDFGNTTGIKVKETEDIQKLLKLLVQNNITIKQFNANEISLQEIFVELAGDDKSEEAAND